MVLWTCVIGVAAALGIRWFYFVWRDEQIHKLLNNKRYYSLSIPYVATKIGCSCAYLRSLNGTKLHHDLVNVFVFKNVEYIGLESRRLAYERDSLDNKNWVEDAIAAGLYD